MTERRGIPAATLAMVGWAASGVISKGLDEIGPVSVAFWRMWLYTAIVLAFLKLNGAPLRLAAIKTSFWGGFSLAFDIMLFFISLRLTTVANATVVASLQPILMLAIAPKIFGEYARPRQWGLTVFAIAGVGVTIFGSSGLPTWNITGDLISFVTLLAWTGYFVASKLATQKIDSSQFTGGSALVCSLVITPFALVSGQAFDTPSVPSWIWLGLLAIGPGFMSHMMMNWALARIPAWLGSVLTLAIPVTSTLLAWAFIGELVHPWQFVGMGVVAAALTLIVIDQSISNRHAARPEQ